MVLWVIGTEVFTHRKLGSSRPGKRNSLGFVLRQLLSDAD